MDRFRVSNVGEPVARVEPPILVSTSRAKSGADQFVEARVCGAEYRIV
jgi:hypothetical protein